MKYVVLARYPEEEGRIRKVFFVAEPEWVTDSDHDYAKLFDSEEEAEDFISKMIWYNLGWPYTIVEAPYSHENENTFLPIRV